MNNPRKAGTYCRKSSEGDEKQILSTEGQEEENLKLLQRNGDTLIKKYKEEKSAKKPGKRDEYKQMIKDFLAGIVSVLYCWKLNRLARNSVEAGEIQWMLQEGIIKAIITPERTYLPGDNILMMLLEFGMATQYSIDLGKDVKRGMKQKAKMGWKPGVAPIGYLPDYHGLKGEREVFVDPERFEKVRTCWDLLLTGTKTVPEITAYATKVLKLTILGSRKHGPRPLTRNTLYQVFTNPFYYGEFVWAGEVCEGLHKPMIFVPEYDKAQEILGRKGRPRPHKNEAPYSKLIHCGECVGKCNCKIIVDVKRKYIKSESRTREYRYYRCSKRSKGCECKQSGSTTEPDLEQQLSTIVDAVNVPEPLLKWTLKKLRATQADRKQQHRKTLTKFQDGYKEIVSKIDRLVDRQLNELTALPEDTFKAKLEQMEKDKKHHAALIQDFDANTSQWTQEVITALTITHNLRQKYATSSRQVKIEILGLLGQRLELRNGKLTFSLAEPFATIFDAKTVFTSQKGRLEKVSDALERDEKKAEGQYASALQLWCRGEDSNFHVLADTRPSSVRVYQFRHHGNGNEERTNENMFSASDPEWDEGSPPRHVVHRHTKKAKEQGPQSVAIFNHVQHKLFSPCPCAISTIFPLPS